MKLKKFKITKSQAKKILGAGEVNGKKLTSKQLALYKLIADGEAPMRLNDIPVSARQRLKAA